MQEGFFTLEEVQSADNVSNKISGCAECKLYKGCNTPRMAPTGEGKKGILIIAEAPGETEDVRGIQLVGEAGQILRRKLKWQGIDLDKDCRKTNAVCCRPPKNDAPTPAQIECCRPKVWKEIERFKPHLILLLGNAAIKSYFGHRVKGLDPTVTKWRGWHIPDRETNAWVVPTFHPSYVLRMDNNPAVEKVFEMDIQSAMTLIDKVVYKPIMSESSGVEIVEDDKQLIDQLKKIYEFCDLIAFDYETTGLKPHREGHEIVSCSIAASDARAISFMMPKKGTKAWSLFKRILIAEQIKKIAHNIKFENAWSLVRMGCEVKGWLWDSMLAAHVLDNREGITGLKFQALVRFGVLDYNSHIEPFLRGVDSKDANSFNRIHKVPKKDLLTYGGIDGMLEFRLAQLQMEEMNYDYRAVSLGSV